MYVLDTCSSVNLQTLIFQRCHGDILVSEVKRNGVGDFNGGRIIDIAAVACHTKI